VVENKGETRFPGPYKPEVLTFSPLRNKGVLGFQYIKHLIDNFQTQGDKINRFFLMNLLKQRIMNL
jgi:hypothetical protein